MATEKTHRRKFLGAAATCLAVASGCSELSNAISGQKVRKRTSLSTTSDNQYIVGQPTLASAPAVDGWLVTDPEWMDSNIRWDQLDREGPSLRRIQGNIGSETFLTVIAGALPYGYEMGYSGTSYLEERTIHIKTKATKVTGGNDPNDPEYDHVYSFILWGLLNDANQPTEMNLNASFDALPTETRTETTE